jgi:hypothetical protein
MWEFWNHSITSTQNKFYILCIILGRAIAQAVSSWLPRRRPGFDPGSGQVGFVVDKVVLEQVLSEHFGFSCLLSFH